MAGVLMVVIGADRAFVDVVARWAEEMSDGSELIAKDMDPPVDIGWLSAAGVVLVDGTLDLALGVAECARIRPSGVPTALLAPGGVSVDRAARRAGVSHVFSGPVRRTALEHILSCVTLPRVGKPTGTSSADSSRLDTIDLIPGVTVERCRRTLRVLGKEQALSAQKFDLLCYLLDKRGVAISATELVRSGILRPSQAQRYKGLIHELKVHLGPARDLIRPVPGFGYRFEQYANSRC
jgi:DNA-binding response OmpR family regulator